MLSNNQLVLLHPKSLNVLYKIDIGHVVKVTVSPYKDNVVVFHINSEVSDFLKKKYSAEHGFDSLFKQESSPLENVFL